MLRQVTTVACLLALTSCGFGKPDFFKKKNVVESEPLREADPTNTDDDTEDDSGDDGEPRETTDAPRGGTSYLPVANEEEFETMRSRMVAEKPEVMARQQS